VKKRKWIDDVLAEGERVEYELVDGEKGPAASNVVKVGA